MIYPDNIEKRIEVKIKGNCWNWIGNKIGRDSRAAVYWKKQTRYAARVIYELTYGDIPTGMCVLHTCDNPACVNPEHLFLGTQKDNAIDRERKGRNRAFSRPFVGESNGSAKLTDEQVLYILNSSNTMTSLAAHYQVSVATISLIKSGKLWSHLRKGVVSDYDS